MGAAAFHSAMEFFFKKKETDRQRE
jgi:hypothetical protein